MPSWFRDPSAPEPNQPLRIGAVAFRVEVEAADPIASEESHELRFVSRAELEALDFTPAHRPIVERYLARPKRVVVE